MKPSTGIKTQNFKATDLLECFAVIETSYGKLFEFDDDKKTLMQRTWLSALQEFPKNVVKKAVFDLCKSERYPPSLSQVIKSSNLILTGLIEKQESLKIQTEEDRKLQEWSNYEKSLSEDEKKFYYENSRKLRLSEEVGVSTEMEIFRAEFINNLEERLKRLEVD